MGAASKGRARAAWTAGAVAAVWSVVLCPAAAAGAEPVDGGAAIGPPQVPTFDLPWGDRAPRMQRIGTQMWLTAAALGRPDPRVRRMSTMLRTARRQAESRARSALHRWVDDALARVQAQPLIATAAHRAVDEHERVLGVRPLVDAAAVVLVGLPVAALRRAVPLRGVPWAP